MTAGEILYSPGTSLSHVHFPLSGVISTRIPFGRHSNLQVELTGTEGMIGMPLVFGANAAMFHRHVQFSGTSLCITSAGLRQELTSSRALRETLGRYACVLHAQLAEIVGCNSFHLLEARLARWILETLDRAHSNQFHLTHEALGEILGVRRESITSAASNMQRRKLIKYSRGEITILNRAGIVKTACQCYSSARNIYEHYLGI